MVLEEVVIQCYMRRFVIFWIYMNIHLSIFRVCFQYIWHLLLGTWVIKCKKYKRNRNISLHRDLHSWSHIGIGQITRWGLNCESLKTFRVNFLGLISWPSQLSREEENSGERCSMYSKLTWAILSIRYAIMLVNTSNVISLIMKLTWRILSIRYAKLLMDTSNVMSLIMKLTWRILSIRYGNLQMNTSTVMSFIIKLTWRILSIRCRIMQLNTSDVMSLLMTLTRGIL